MTDLDFIFGVLADDADKRCLATGDRWGRKNRDVSLLTAQDRKNLKARRTASRIRATKLGIDWRALAD